LTGKEKSNNISLGDIVERQKMERKLKELRLKKVS
jgi:hypothetical protein